MKYAFGKGEETFGIFIEYGVLADDIYVNDYLKLKKRLKIHDVLYLESVYVLGNTKGEVLKELKDLSRIHIQLKVLDIPSTLLDFKDEFISSLTLGIIVETFESTINNDLKRQKQRQREGIDNAKSQGKYIGRQPIPIDWDKFGQLYQQWKVGAITAVRFQKEMGLRANTFYRRLRDYEETVGSKDTVNEFLQLVKAL